MPSRITLSLFVIVACCWCAGCEPSGTPAPVDDEAAAPKTSAAVTAADDDEVAEAYRYTELPPSWYLEFEGYLPDDPAEPGTPPNRTGPGRFYYDFPMPPPGELGDGKMKTTFANCPPLPCVPEEWVKTQAPCAFYLLRYPTSDDDYQTLAVRLDQESAPAWSAIARNFGPVWPDFVARYHVINPYPPLPEPPANLQVVGNPTDEGQEIPTWWYTAAGVGAVWTGGEGGRFEETDFVAMLDDEKYYRTEGGNTYRPLYSFAGKHGQAVYDWRGWQIEQQPADEFEVPELGIDVTPDGCPDVFPFDSVDQPPNTSHPTRVMVCTACHVSTLQALPTPPPVG